MSNNKSNQTLKIGDVVNLKSSGPDMTVDKITEDGGIFCVWFAGEHYDKVSSYYFQPDSLRLTQENES